MAYNVHITDNQTGESKIVLMDLDWFDHSVYWWTRGNFSCDCNRGDTFYAGEDVDIPCGFTRFTVLKVVFKDGTEILIDEAK